MPAPLVLPPSVTLPAGLPDSTFAELAALWAHRAPRDPMERLLATRILQAAARLQLSAAREPEQLSLQGVLRRPPNLTEADADFAVCCAVPVDAEGLTIVARPAGRPGEKLEHGDALFSRKFGQSTGVCLFDRVFGPRNWGG